MNSKNIESNWAELKGKILSKWSKFNDAELESVKGDLNQLAAKIQKTYGIAKDQADRQLDEFKTTVRTLIGDEPNVTPVAQPATLHAVKATEEPAVTKKAAN